ncbi:MAG: Hsp70 family protein [Anaplasma ovis]
MQLLDITEPTTTELGVAFGIDLGTTNSLIAVVEHDGSVKVFEDPTGRSLIPSIVEYTRNGTVNVGHDANPLCALRSTKRLMGKLAKDVHSGSFCGTKVVDKNGSAALSVDQDKAITPVEAAAEVLKCLVKLVKNSTGQDVTHAVITVPAYFDEVARKATRDAAMMAGIGVLRLLSEPTASALSYKVEQAGGAEICAVYDFGGGTFDVSVLRLYDGVFQVLATGGDTHLGGDDIDQLLAELVVAKYKSWKREQVCGDPYADGLVLDACNAKKALSGGNGGAFEFRICGDVFQCSITDAEFTEVVDKVVSRTMKILKQTISDAGIEPRDVSRVILVGGSSKIPRVKAALDSMFCGRVFDSVDPEKAVAVGAALQAYYLSNPAATGKKVLVDVVPLSLSLEVMGGAVETIISRNTPVPALVTQEFTTYTDGQTAIHIHVCQGEREMADANRSLARFDIKVPPLPAGEARVKVEFRVDMDGLLVVSVREKSTGLEKCVEVHQLEGITSEDVKRHVLGAVENFDEDMASRELSAGRVECARIAELLEGELASGRLSGVALQEANDALSGAKIAMAGSDVEKMRDAAKKLRERLVDCGKLHEE